MATSLERKKIRCRQVDQLRKPLGFIKNGDKREFIASLASGSLRTQFQERLLAASVSKDQSPLVLAAQHNRPEILKYILKHFRANLEQETSTVIEGGHPVEGATPLWTASTLGHLGIVKELVSRGADIEHTTQSQSTPLRGAAFDGHLEVVKFLISRGANIDKPNQVGQSPLTIAAAMQKVDTVKFLLEKGANLFHHGHNGDTPLHVAVESGSKDVTKILVEAGARNIPNDVGYTPAILASCYGHHEITEFLDKQFHLDPKESYDCLCLLFTKEVLNANLSSSIKWLKMAISLRRENPDLFKDLPASDPIYDGVQEPVTESELDGIVTDDIQSFFLCSVYCERILGNVHPTTAFYIRISGDLALEEKRYDKCMQLWLRSLHFDKAARMAYELQITEDLLFCVRGFTTMVADEYFPDISEHFAWGIREFKMAKDSKISEADVACCLCRMLAIWIKVSSLMEGEKKVEEESKVRQAAIQLLCLLEEKGSPLLLACIGNTPHSRSAHNLSAGSTIAVSELPLERVVALLLDIGCPVDSEDQMGNYPLHIAVSLREDSALSCVKTLIEYGAHVDAVNHHNQTALQVAKLRTGFKNQENEIISVLREATVRHTTLQCLASKAVVREGLDYVKVLPPQVANFVAKHEADLDVSNGEEEENEAYKLQHPLQASSDSTE